MHGEFMAPLKLVSSSSSLLPNRLGVDNYNQNHDKS